jgi:phage terminase large subunit
MAILVIVMATIAISPLERFLQTARQAGCPADQVLNFRRGGYVPQPKQLLFHAACREADRAEGPTEVGYGGARGPGKSHALLAQMALDDCQRYPGLKGLLLRKVGKAVRESFEDLRLKVLPAIPHDYRRADGVLQFPNGSRIILGHFKDERDVEAYLGLEDDVIGVEEATTLSSSKYKAIQSCNRTSKPDWRPRMYSSTNPGGIGHAWYKQLFIMPFRAGEETETRFIPATVDDNAFINPEYRRRLDSLTGWLKRAWRYGDWDISAGQYFTTFRHDVHVREPFPIPAQWRVWLAMDYGFTHWNVIYLLAEDGDGNAYFVGEHAERRWLVSRHAEALRAMLQRHKVEPGRIWTFQAGRDCFSKDKDGKSIADQWEAKGFTFEPANDDRINGAAEMLRRLGDVDAGIQPSVFFFDTCARLTECLPAMEHDPHRPEDVLKVNTDEDGLGGDDPYDAARYGLMAVASTTTLEAGKNPMAGYRG